MRKKKKTAFEMWFDEQVQSSDPDFKRQVQETLRKMRLKQDTAAFFAEPRRRADLEAFDRITNRAGGEPPRNGDEI